MLLNSTDYFLFDTGSFQLRRESSLGMSLPEFSIALSVLGVLAALTAPLLRIGNHPLNDSVKLLEANFKMARAKAMSQTKAYRIRPDGSFQFMMEKHNPGVGASIYNCADADVSYDQGQSVWSKSLGFNAYEDMALKDGVRVKRVAVNGNEVDDINSWSVCFNSRGLADKNLILTLEDIETGQAHTVEVFAGGSLISYD